MNLMYMSEQSNMGGKDVTGVKVGDAVSRWCSK